MHKNDWILIAMIAALIVLIAGFFLIAGYKVDSGLIKYTNKNGEAYNFRADKVFNDTMYRVKIFGAYDYSFVNSPFSVENISVEKDAELALNRPAGTSLIYITQDLEFLNKTGTDSVIAISEFSRILGNQDYGVFKMNVKAAFTSPESAKTTVASCANVSDTIAVIYVKEGEDKIYTEKGCLIIQGTKEDIIKVADRFAYYLAGVVV